MLPEGWKETTLNNILEKIIDYRGKSVPKSTAGIQLITAKNIKFGFLDFTDKEFISEDSYADWAVRGIPKLGDILFTTEAPLGNVCKYPEFGQYVIGQRVLCLRPKINSDLLFHILLSEDTQNKIKISATGSTALGIKSSELKKISICYPEKEYEQEKIAAILSIWDKAISTTDALLANSRQQKKALMQQLLTGKRRLPGFTGEWKVVRAGSVLHEEGARNRGSKITRVLSVTNQKGFVLPEEQFSKRVASDNIENYKIIKRGQFGYNPSRLNVGSFGRLDTFEEGILSPLYVIFSIKDEYIDSDFFLAWMHSGETRQRIKGSTQGSVRESVSFNALASFPLNLPPLDEQRAIAAVLDAADREIVLLEQKAACLREEKKALMQQLLTGKRRVRL